MLALVMELCPKSDLIFSSTKNVVSTRVAREHIAYASDPPLQDQLDKDSPGD